MKNVKGFTMVELIVAIGIFVVLAATTFFLLNPAKRLGNANTAQRWEDITALAKAVELYQIDNGTLPSDLSSVTVWTNQKQVLCSSVTSLTCDGQDRDCLVVDDIDFLGKYVDSLPIDPEKSADTDTGYYITRTGDGMMTFGACDSYDSQEIIYVARASLATHTSTCGDGETTGNEVCDDGNVVREGCGNGQIDAAGTYCNASCGSVITIDTTEKCDFYSWDDECEDVTYGWLTTDDVGGYPWCDRTCNQKITVCNVAE